MSTKETPGQLLVAALSADLPPGFEWDAAEQATLDLICNAADRLAHFRMRFGKAAAELEPSPARLVALSGECRLLEGAIARWCGSLDPHDATAKSMRHVHAANARWHPGGAR